MANNSDHPALAWRRCGLWQLSGRANGKARILPVALTRTVDVALAVLKSLSEYPEKLPLNGSLLLGERAALMKLKRNGRNSPTGHCRLLDALGGRLALSLARGDDWHLLEAWLETPTATWNDIHRVVRTKKADDLAVRGAELGLPLALDNEHVNKPWLSETRFTPPASLLLLLRFALFLAASPAVISPLLSIFRAFGRDH